MQYTIRNIPEEVDVRLRERAELLGVSLNEVTIQALRQATHVDPPEATDAPPADRLAAIRGMWKDEPWVEDFVQSLRESDEASMADDREKWNLPDRHA